MVKTEQFKVSKAPEVKKKELENLGGVVSESEDIPMIVRLTNKYIIKTTATLSLSLLLIFLILSCHDNRLKTNEKELVKKF